MYRRPKWPSTAEMAGSRPVFMKDQARDPIERRNCPQYFYADNCGKFTKIDQKAKLVNMAGVYDVTPATRAFICQLRRR